MSLLERRKFDRRDLLISPPPDVGSYGPPPDVGSHGPPSDVGSHLLFEGALRAYSGLEARHYDVDSNRVVAPGINLRAHEASVRHPSFRVRSQFCAGAGR